MFATGGVLPSGNRNTDPSVMLLVEVEANQATDEQYPSKPDSFRLLPFTSITCAMYVDPEVDTACTPNMVRACVVGFDTTIGVPSMSP